MSRYGKDVTSRYMTIRLVGLFTVVALLIAVAVAVGQLTELTNPETATIAQDVTNRQLADPAGATPAAADTSGRLALLGLGLFFTAALAYSAFRRVLGSVTAPSAGELLMERLFGSRM